MGTTMHGAEKGRDFYFCSVPRLIYKVPAMRWIVGLQMEKADMPIFEGLGEFLGEIIFEGAFFSGPVKIYEWLTGKETGINGYRTEQKKFIKFSVAKKFMLTWENDVDHLKDKLEDGLETMNEKITAKDFQFTTLGDKTIIQPPTFISFYSFHFLVQWLTEYKIKTAGVVETVRTTYTTYNDPNSENLIDRHITERNFSFH